MSATTFLASPAQLRWWRGDNTPTVATRVRVVGPVDLDRLAVACDRDRDDPPRCSFLRLYRSKEQRRDPPVGGS